MSHQPTSTTSFNPAWRYGVYTFPIAPLSWLITYVGIGLFVAAAENESVLISIGSFVVTVVSGWAAYLFAILTALTLLFDALALRDHPSWSPNPWLTGGLALAHVAGAVLLAPYLISVPGIGYYVYKRRRRIASNEDNHDGTAIN